MYFLLIFNVLHPGSIDPNKLNLPQKTLPPRTEGRGAHVFRISTMGLPWLKSSAAAAGCRISQQGLQSSDCCEAVEQRVSI
jgi:hypothetical protein